MCDESVYVTSRHTVRDVIKACVARRYVRRRRQTSDVIIIRLYTLIADESLSFQTVINTTRRRFCANYKYHALLTYLLTKQITALWYTVNCIILFLSTRFFSLS